MSKRNKYIKAPEHIGGYVESTSFVQGGDLDSRMNLAHEVKEVNDEITRS